MWNNLLLLTYNGDKFIQAYSFKAFSPIPYKVNEGQESRKTWKREKLYS